MSPYEKKTNPKADVDVTPEEYQNQRRSGCRFVVREGEYGRRICNRVLHDRVFHLCEEHLRVTLNSRI